MAVPLIISDPHGFTLTVISISVVFAALLVLYLIYSLMGKLFTEGPGKLRRKPRGGSADEMTATAIALALEMESGDDAVPAAIALALHLHEKGAEHDIESGVITIRRTGSAWKDKSFNFRKKPTK